MTPMHRPVWDQYFMAIAQNVSSRSNCMSRKIGAIIVCDYRIMTTGYNGTPKGTKNCFEGGCPRCAENVESGTQLDRCYCCHAEENAIIQAAYHGVSIYGGTLYVTHTPCLMCSKMIINAGIKRLVYNEKYPVSDRSLRLLMDGNVCCMEIALL